MTPEERQKLNKLERDVANLLAVSDTGFIESLVRRLKFKFEYKLSDLSDVEDTDDATTGKVLKKTATTWQPGTDLTA